MSFRLDRFGTLYIARPFRKVWGDGVRSIPILMYHSISDQSEDQVHPYYRTSTSLRAFSEQIKHLHRHGYRTINLQDVVAEISSSDAPQKKLVAITFDDGYSDFYAEAFPILNSFGFSATVFLPTAFIADHAI